MNEADKKLLEKIASERLAATADDEERWSYLFRTEGSIGLVLCPWSTTEDWEFDGKVDDLDLPWSKSRLMRSIMAYCHKGGQLGSPTAERHPVEARKDCCADAAL